MPVVPFIPAIIGAGATVYATSQSNKAAKSAQQAQTQADSQGIALQQEQLAESRRQYDLARADREPWRQTGVAALDRINRFFGMGAPGPGEGHTDADYEAYIKSNPELYDYWKRNSEGQGITLAQQGRWHHGNWGETDPRYKGDLKRTPDASVFTTSPDYQFRVNEGTRAITGNAAARGLLDSGATGKGLIDFGQQAASQEFGAWFNRFATLAGFGADANAGNAASGQGLISAGQAGANNITGLLQNSAAARGSSYQQQAANNGGLVTGLAGMATGLIQNMGARSPNVPLTTNAGVFTPYVPETLAAPRIMNQPLNMNLPRAI